MERWQAAITTADIAGDTGERAATEEEAREACRHLGWGEPEPEDASMGIWLVALDAESEAELLREGELEAEWELDYARKLVVISIELP